jgi:hypothetical protein
MYFYIILYLLLDASYLTVYISTLVTVGECVYEFVKSHFLIKRRKLHNDKYLIQNSSLFNQRKRLFCILLCYLSMWNFPYWQNNLKKLKHPIFLVKTALDHFYSFGYSKMVGAITHWSPLMLNYCNRTGIDFAENIDDLDA